MARMPWCVVVPLLIASPLAAQNLVTNGSFNTNVAIWSIPAASDGSLVHDPTLDVDGSPASGSGLLTNVVPVAFGTVAPDQCIAVTAGQQYYWGGSIRFPVNETTTGNTAIVVNFFNMAGCTGTELLAVTGTSRDPATAARGVWHTSNSGSIAGGTTAPAGSVSALINLLSTRIEADGTRSANFDGVFFAQVGTVPVELVGFEID